MYVCDQHSFFLFQESIELDLKIEFERSRTEQIDTESMEDFKDKNMKILPPHVEELKRQVSIIMRELL